MKKYIYTLLLSLLSLSAFAQYSVTGGIGKPPYQYSDNLIGTGVDKVYLLNTLSADTITYTRSRSNLATVNFYSYTQSSADRLPIPKKDISRRANRNDSIFKIFNLEDSRGYVIEEAGATKRIVLWIVDYSIHQPILNSITVSEGSNRCEGVTLNIAKTNDELYLNAYTGGRRRINRIYTVSFNTLEWKQEQSKFLPKVVENTLTNPTNLATAPAPLIPTKYTFRGDQFAEHFEMPKSITSADYTPVRVEGHIVTQQLTSDADNVLPGKSTTGTLGGSAPVIIDFFGHANEPTNYFYTWFLYDKSDMLNPVARYTDRDINYTFDKDADYKVRLEVADRNSVCIQTDSVEFNVSDFDLDIPNFFSPGTSTGSNDEFRVAYRSVITFKATIFNRWGVKIYEWTDPAQGWDGRYKGSYVSPGVYYCVVQATDGRGRKHVKNSDVNILHGR